MPPQSPECVEVLRAPDVAAKCYRDHAVLRRGDHVTLVAFPHASVAVTDLLPPAREDGSFDDGAGAHGRATLDAIALRALEVRGGRHPARRADAHDGPARAAPPQLE